MLRLPDHGRVATKRLLRNDFSDAWEAFAEEEARQGWEQLSQPAAVASLEAIQRLLSGGKVGGTKGGGRRGEKEGVQGEGERARL